MFNRTVSLLLVVVVIRAVASFASAQDFPEFVGEWPYGPAKADVVIDLGRGPVTVHVPPIYDPSLPAPLVVLLHGYR